jgi:hypothetical protein
MIQYRLLDDLSEILVLHMLHDMEQVDNVLGHELKLNPVNNNGSFKIKLTHADDNGSNDQHAIHDINKKKQVIVALIFYK